MKKEENGAHLLSSCILVLVFVMRFLSLDQYRRILDQISHCTLNPWWINMGRLISSTLNRERNLPSLNLIPRPIIGRDKNLCLFKYKCLRHLYLMKQYFFIPLYLIKQYFFIRLYLIKQYFCCFPNYIWICVIRHRELEVIHLVPHGNKSLKKKKLHI